MNRSVDTVARRYLAPHLHGLELHVQEIKDGQRSWGRIPRPVKNGLLSDIPRLIGTFGNHPGYGLFAVARAPQAVPAANPFERTFEELLLRFTQMLIRLRNDGEDHFGLVVADEARYERVLQPLVARWRSQGTRFARLGRLAEVPLFIDSRATRMTQAADS